MGTNKLVIKLKSIQTILFNKSVGYDREPR